MSEREVAIPERLRRIDKEIRLLGHSIALLHWDQETGMPKRGVDERSEQVGLIEGMAHEKLASEEVGELLEQVGSTHSSPTGGKDVSEEDRSYLRALRREHERARKIPTRLVTELAEEVSTAQVVWRDAKNRDNFSLFRPHLEKILRLNMEKAEAVGYEEDIYDALLDEFEPWMSANKVGEVFDELRSELIPLVEELGEKKSGDDSFLYYSYPVDDQRAFVRRLLDELDFDFERGRLDETVHPFTTAVGGDDVRITTHYKENNLKSALFGTIHEAGHAFYEMGVAEKYKTSVLGQGTSLGIHESQSRIWENVIGRSISFWRRYFPLLREYFPAQLEDVTLSKFIAAINRVEPSFIRIEADEVSYSLHVILRFELERAMVNGDLSVSDLPGEWSRSMENLLGIRPRTDAEGVLQDVHWAMGAIGYFPTYALGNLYGAQFDEKMREDLDDPDALIAKGNFEPVRRWMEEHIHRHGAAKTPRELIQEVTGKDLEAEPFLSYLRKKYSRIHEI